MKAREVLKRYQEGRRDFRGEDLREQNFKGKDLCGADFSEADIRGANFTKANLTGAKFVKARAGLPQRWVMILLFACFLFSGIAGFFALFVGVYIASIFHASNLENMIAGWIFLITLVGFGFLAIRRGINAVPFAVVIAGAFAFATAIAGTGAVVRARAFVIAAVFAIAFAGAIAFVIAFAVVIAGAIAGATAIAGAGAGTFAVIIASAFAGAGTLAVAFAGAGAVARAVAFAGAFLIFSAFLGWRTIRGDKRDAWIRSSAVAFAATGGTCFRYAILTGTDFTQATLKNTDFRNANLTHTCFKDAQKLDLARPGNTYLNNPQVRELVIAHNGANQNFDRQDLQGVYLKGANLVGASFIEANLVAACLQEANLTDSKLVHTLLDYTNFTGATLTGAYIEAWNITLHTKLDGVCCKYIFMHLPPKERPAFIAVPPEKHHHTNPRRKPDDWDQCFEDGDCADFIALMRLTLDLYHNKPVDPRLVALAFEKLTEDNPQAEIELVSIEKRGKNKDKLLMRAETASKADHSALSASYFHHLETLQALPPEAIQTLLAERATTIQLLAGLLEGKQHIPNIDISPVFTQGGMTVSNDSKSFSISDSNNVRVAQGDNSVTPQGDQAQAVQGDHNQQAQGIPKTPEEPLTKENVINLLADLEKLIKESDLPADSKDEVHTYLSAAKKAIDKPEPKKQAALINLEQVTETLETATKTVGAGKTLWTTAKPIIIKVATWLGAVAAGSVLGGL